MPSNEIKINGTVVYEVPDSFMRPLEAYLEMVQEKTGQLLEEAPESRRPDGWIDAVPVQNDSVLQRLVNESLHMSSELTETLGPILRPDDRPIPEAMDSSPIVETAQALHGTLEKLVRRVDL